MKLISELTSELLEEVLDQLSYRECDLYNKRCREEYQSEAWYEMDKASKRTRLVMEDLKDLVVALNVEVRAEARARELIELQRAVNEAQEADAERVANMAALERVRRLNAKLNMEG